MSPCFVKEPCEGVDARPEERAAMMKLLKSGEGDLLTPTRYFRHLVTCVRRPSWKQSAQDLAKGDCVPILVKLMKVHDKDDDELPFEASWVICNIAATTTANTKAVVDAGAVPILITHLSSSDSLRYGAVQALGNITLESAAYRDMVLSHNCIKLLLPLLKEGSGVPLTDSVWLLRGLCTGRSPGPTLARVKPALPLLARLALHPDDEVCEEACWALSSLCTTHGHALYQTLAPYLDPSFVDNLRNRSGKFPARLVKELNFFLQDSADPQDAQVDNSKNQTVKNSPGNPGLRRTSRKRSRSSSESDSAKSLSRSRSRSKTRSRSRTPVLEGVSTRNTPKRFRLSSKKSILVQAPPAVVKTRAAARNLMTRTPNHSASYAAQTKAQVFEAAVAGDVSRVEEAVQDVGAAITTGAEGSSLLHVAAFNNHPQLVLFLLQYISPNLVDKENRTPAHVAAIKCRLQVLKLLLADSEIDPSKRDITGATYADWLSSHLLEAVLGDDVGRVNSLLSVGANPDQQAARLVDGAMSKELGLSTPRQVAHNLQRHPIIRLFSQVQEKKNDVSSGKTSGIPFTSLPLAPMRVQVTLGSPQISGSDCYKMSTTFPRGYVSVFSYSSFQQRPDLALEAAHPDSHNVASVFTKMGYTGHAYYDLTAEQTRHEVARVRQLDQLDSVDCAVFVVSSHGTPQQQVVTSDLQLVNADWFCQQFKDSQCPALRNKPKLFIFDLCCGYYQAEAERGREAARGPSCRVEEPLRDMVCLYSNSGSFTGYTFTKEGSPFISALCRSLADHAHHHELSQLWRHLLSQLTTAVPRAAATLHNNGFSKQFYFNPSVTH